MNISKSLTMFMLDGDENGRIKCKIGGWTGLAYKIPRDKLQYAKETKDLKESKELTYTGVYFLLGEEAGKGKVYIG